MAVLEAGSLLFKMAADTAQIKSDMDKVKGIVGDGVSDVISTLKKVAVAYAGIASIDAFADMVKSSIRAADALGELSTKTGASVEALSGLAAVGKLTGTSADQIGEAMNKLAKSTASMDENGKGAAQALRALGVDFDDFQKMSPDEKMQRIALAMSDFGDGSGKSAAAMALFGKTGAEMLPFMRDLAETGELQAKVTTEQAAQAHEFDTSLKKLQTSGEAWKKELSMGMLPALTDASTAMIGLYNSSGGLREQLKKLVDDGTIDSWVRGAVTGLSYVTDGVTYVVRAFKIAGEFIFNWAMSVGDVFGGVGRSLDMLKQGNFTGAIDSMSSSITTAKGRMVDFAAQSQQTWGEETFGSKLRARMGELEGVKRAHTELRPQVDLAAAAVQKHGEAVDKARQAGIDWIANLDKVGAALQMEEDLGRKLTKAEQERLDLEDKLKTGKIKLTDAEIAHANAVINANDAIQKNISWQKQANSENDKAAEAIFKTTEKLKGQVKAQQDINDKIGKTPEQLVALQLASLKTQKQEAMRMADATIGGEDVRQAYLDQAAAFGQLQGKVKDGVVLKAAADAAAAWKTTVDGITNGLTNGLMQAFESGKGFARAFRDMLVNAFKTLVLQPVINFIVSPITGAVSSALAGLLGTGSAVAGTGGALAGASGAGGIFSGLGSLGTLASSLGTFGTAAGYGASALFGGTGLTALAGAADMIGAGSLAGGFGMAAGVLGPVALGLAALSMLDKKSTPHMGGYSLADASGNVSDITSVMGGKQNTTTQQTTNALAASVSALLNKTGSAFGLTPNLSVRSVFEADNKDAAEALFHILDQSGAKVAGFDQTTGSTLAADSTTAYGQYTSQAAGSVRSAIQNLGLPDWALAEFNQLGAGATIDDIAAVAQKVIDEQNRKKNGDPAATSDPLSGPLVQADYSPLLTDMRDSAKATAEAAKTIAEKMATAEWQVTTCDTMTEGFKQAIAQIELAVARLSAIDQRDALVAARAI